MQLYQHILLAVDYSAQGDYVASKALGLAKQFQATLSLVHILDNIPMPDTNYGTVIPLNQNTDHDLLEQEKARFTSIADRLQVAKANRWLIWGVPKNDIVDLANRQNVDLIVVGSHGRHGLSLLLGSTANSVLHHAKCDVMAVRLQEN
ncbi:MAG: universal stress protein [Methylococcaceae bacterium]|nr:universal stress protein [Methylococcaceae bacterium]